METLLNTIEDIKTKISDNEYLVLMNSLKDLYHDENVDKLKKRVEELEQEQQEHLEYVERLEIRMCHKRCKIAELERKNLQMKFENEDLKAKLKKKDERIEYFKDKYEKEPVPPSRAVKCDVCNHTTFDMKDMLPTTDEEDAPNCSVCCDGSFYGIDEDDAYRRILESYTTDMLRKLIRSTNAIKVKGLSKMRKARLVELLMSNADVVEEMKRRKPRTRVKSKPTEEQDKCPDCKVKLKLKIGDTGEYSATVNGVHYCLRCVSKHD